MASMNNKRSNYYTHLPAKIFLFLPICDNNLNMATILAWCYELEAIAVNEWENKQQEEQKKEDQRRASMTDEEWEEYQTDKMEIGYEQYLDRLLDDYNGESWLYEAEDDVEGFEGRFDISYTEAKRQIAKFTSGLTWENKVEEEKIDDKEIQSYINALLNIFASIIITISYSMTLLMLL